MAGQQKTPPPAAVAAIPPRFAVQRAGGGKARILAIHERQYPDFEAVTVTTVDSLPVATRLAHGLNLAWREGRDRFKPLAYIKGLPEPVVKAVEDALTGCPRTEQFALPSEDYEAVRAARLATNFADNDLLTPLQAWHLQGQLDLLADQLGDDLADDERTALPVPAEIAGAVDAQWADSFVRAYKDLSFDILCGRVPTPTTFAEIIALWEAVSDMTGYMEMQEDLDIDVPDLLPQSPRDGVLREWDQLWTDLLTLPVLEAAGTGTDLETEMTLEAFCTLLPASRWHDILPGRLPRDPHRWLV